MAEPRIRNCETTQEMERVVDDMAISGYKILKRSDSSALLKKTDNGSAGIHVLLFLLTFGFGNLVYWLVKRGNSDQVLVKVRAN